MLDRHGGRRPAIHVFARSSTARRGCRAFARHDAVRQAHQPLCQPLGTHSLPYTADLCSCGAHVSHRGPRRSQTQPSRPPGPWRPRNPRPLPAPARRADPRRSNPLPNPPQQAGEGALSAYPPTAARGLFLLPLPLAGEGWGGGRAGGYSAAAAAATLSPSRTPRTAYSAATLIASIMLTALARPVPAMSNAVP
jgi:hypothetical protein